MSSEVVGNDWAGRVVDETFVLREWLGGTERSGVFATELPGGAAEKATIKLIVADGAEAEERIAGWQGAARVAHPHLVRVLGTGRCEVGGTSFVYVVTEYADEVLANVLRERALTADETREMLEPAVDALLFLHAKGFVHGHVKPSNLLAVNDQLKLSADGLVAAGSMRKGVAAREIYRAPESGSGPIAPAEDVWSVGVTVVEALTQRPPEWDGASSAGPVVPDSMAQPFAAIARACLRVDAAERCKLSVVKALLAGGIEAEINAEASAKAGPDVVAQDLVVNEPVAQTAARSIWDADSAAIAGANKPERSSTIQQAVVANAALPSRGPIAAPATLRREVNAEPPRRLRVVPIVLAASVVMAIIVALVLHSYKSELTVPEQGGAAAAGASESGRANGAVLERVLPAVPEKASATIRGAVLLTVRVKVNGAGEVTDATLASPGPSKYFARFALEASRKWKFKPARRGGQSVASVWTLHYQFRADGIKVTPEEEAP
jgi:TonB family protein